jgi:hypothetical protein
MVAPTKVDDVEALFLGNSVRTKGNWEQPSSGEKRLRPKRIDRDDPRQERSDLQWPAESLSPSQPGQLFGGDHRDVFNAALREQVLPGRGSTESHQCDLLTESAQGSKIIRHERLRLQGIAHGHVADSHSIFKPLLRQTDGVPIQQR